MLAYALKRLFVALLVTITVSVVTFTLLRFSGDPAAALCGEGCSEEEIESVRTNYGYDRPLVAQYFTWAEAALQGDFGRSHYLRAQVADVIFEHLPTTMILGALALAFALAVSIPLGVVAEKQRTVVLT